jgi:hypothetical protein
VLVLLSQNVAAVAAENQISEEIQILARGGPDESQTAGEWRSAVRGVCGRPFERDRPRGPDKAAARLLYRFDAARRAQERGTDGGADSSGADGGAAPIAAALCRPAYGNDSRLRAGMTALGVPYVAGILPNTLMWRSGTGPRRTNGRLLRFGGASSGTEFGDCRRQIADSPWQIFEIFLFSGDGGWKPGSIYTEWQEPQSHRSGWVRQDEIVLRVQSY